MFLSLYLLLFLKGTYQYENLMELNNVNGVCKRRPLVFFTLGYNKYGNCYAVPRAAKWVSRSSNFTQLHYLNKPKSTMTCKNTTFCYQQVDIAFYSPRYDYFLKEIGCNYTQCRSKSNYKGVTQTIPIQNINKVEFQFPSVSASSCRINPAAANSTGHIRQMLLYIPIYLQITYQLSPSNLNVTFYHTISLSDGTCDGIITRKPFRKRGH